MNKPETVLIVDDESIVRVLIREILERAGFSVLDAPDGDSAIEIFLRHQAAINLIILDMMMPGKDGREVAKQFLEIHPGLAILFISGFSEISPPEGCAFLPKPFSSRELADRAREVINRMGSEAAGRRANC